MEEDKNQNSPGNEGEGDGSQSHSHIITRETYQELTPKNVESEHLKNIIVSLSSKIVTTNDLEKEIETVTITLNQNEEARTTLQSQLGNASSLAHQRAEETKAREDEMNQEINSLRTNVDKLDSD